MTINDSERVRAGDLLNPDLWNRIVSRVMMLQKRIVELEGNAGLPPPTLDELQFTAPLRIGDTLTLLGKNLASAEVLVAGQVVQSYSQRTASRLVVVVPEIPSWFAAAVAEVQVRDPSTGRDDLRHVELAPRAPTTPAPPNA